MPHRTFFTFIFPSLLAMLLFITLPIMSVVVQSLFQEHEAILTTVENCGPFGCEKQTKVDTDAMARLKADNPLGQYAGLSNYLNRNHLALDELGQIFSEGNGPSVIAGKVMNLPFYRALAFTLVYCFTVTPLAMALGFAVAMAVNSLPRFWRGPAIFISILPMIITPLVGSLILAWMFNPAGIIGATLCRTLTGDSHPVAAGIAGADLGGAVGLWRSGPTARFLLWCSTPVCRPCRRTRWKAPGSMAPRAGSASALSSSRT
jgi:ABC-type sugar transport system permease subunit